MELPKALCRSASTAPSRERTACYAWRLARVRETSGRLRRDCGAWTLLHERQHRPGLWSALFLRYLDLLVRNLFFTSYRRENGRVYLAEELIV
jgi:hypothetical protein